jgi:hypothetical protein
MEDDINVREVPSPSLGEQEGAAVVNDDFPPSESDLEDTDEFLEQWIGDEEAAMEERESRRAADGEAATEITELRRELANAVAESLDVSDLYEEYRERQLAARQ